MSKRELSLLIDDILQSCIKIKKYTADLSFDDFLDDEKTLRLFRHFVFGFFLARINIDRFNGQ